MKKFLEFIREQGVVGLAVGFILGGAISKFISSLVSDIINPVLGIALGFADNFKDSYLQIGPAKIMWGNFLNVTIDFVTISLVVYFTVKVLKLDRLDKKKE